MKKEDKKILQDLVELMKDDLTERSSEFNTCLNFIINEFKKVYEDHREFINIKLSVESLNGYASSMSIINDDPNLYEGSFRVIDFGDHIFGSRKILFEELDLYGYTINDTFYVSELEQAMEAIGLRGFASRFVACVLTDIYHNGLIGIDVRPNQASRRVLRDINCIIKYIDAMYFDKNTVYPVGLVYPDSFYDTYNESGHIEMYCPFNRDTFKCVISKLTFGKNDIFEAIRYYRYEKKDKTPIMDNGIIDITGLFDDD